MAAARKDEPQKPPLPQPEYPAIATFVDTASAEDVEALFRGLKDGLGSLKGPKVDQAKKISKAIERTEELMSHLLQVREKLASTKKNRR